jgi:hypothetical protein
VLSNQIKILNFVFLLINITPITRIFMINVAFKINVIAPYRIGAPNKKNQNNKIYKS